ncbi:MAG: CIA30 family protein [Candidatus Sericytochromatia bacterium]|nr:CIA30 family protein [Candidatus Sericytochromatia bacterium]
MEQQNLWLDTFENPTSSRLGNSWQAFTDRVMGGKSTMRAWHESTAGQSCLRITGEVRLENRGGFIEVALPLVTRGHPFDASHLQGLRLRVRGRQAPFQVHLRTSDHVRPWEHHRAQAFAALDWHQVDIPFDQFEPRMTAAPLNLRKLVRLGLVCAGQAGPAQLDVAAVGLYG